MSDKETHIDDWLDKAACRQEMNIRYAAFVLHLRRLPATYYFAFIKLFGELPLYVKYQGEVYRCNGASRLGDVYLAKNYTRTAGYDMRVAVDGCSEWSDIPSGPFTNRCFKLVGDQSVESLLAQANSLKEGVSTSEDFRKSAREIIGLPEVGEKPNEQQG